MSKETFAQMLARVTAKQASQASNAGPPPPPKLSPSPVRVPTVTTIPGRKA